MVVEVFEAIPRARIQFGLENSPQSARVFQLRWFAGAPQLSSAARLRTSRLGYNVWRDRRWALIAPAECGQSFGARDVNQDRGRQYRKFQTQLLFRSSPARCDGAIYCVC